MKASEDISRLSLSECVEAYEESIATGRDYALESFLPEESHPEYSEIVVEIVRVEIELKGFRQGISVAEYREKFPAVFSDPTRLAVIAFEEYRVRRHSGDPITRQHYSEQFRISTDDWPSIAVHEPISATSPGRVEQVHRRVAPGIIEMETGALLQCVADAFPEFEPVEELGRGAFGRVFLAKQKNLADRFVVIKVTSDTTTEPERLAKLQHTCIMPVYSVHRTQDWQAICMPYFGRRTLKNVPGGSIHDALELVRQVAEGLEHAHRNGILHRDVKPANILVTDNGQPLLLDFNLSSDITAQAMNRSVVGGTIPYLAPEQLESLQSGHLVEATADLYSLGIILFERITGELPFATPTSASLSVLIRSAQERRIREVPRVRDRAPQASMAVQDIILKCLQPAPKDRYQTAAQLAEDLSCELNNRPLRHTKNSSLVELMAKWRRRHPKLLSVTSLTTTLIALLLVSAIGWVWLQNRIDHLHARTQWTAFQESAPAVRALLSSIDASSEILNEGLRTGEVILNDYMQHDAVNWRQQAGVICLAENEQLRVDQELSEIVYLMASACQRRARFCEDIAVRNHWLSKSLHWNSLQNRFVSAIGEKQIWEMQKSSILAGLGLKREDGIKAGTSSGSEPGKLGRFVRAVQLLEAGDVHSAESMLTRIIEERPHDYSAWYLLGKSRQLGRDNSGADAAFSTCIALNSDCWVAWLDRSAVHIAAGHCHDAVHDCDELLIRYPALAEGYLNRALAKSALGDFAAAEHDLTLAIQHGAPTRAIFLRAHVRQQLGAISEAQTDFQQGLKTTPNDCESWISRGMAYLQSEPEQALSDFKEARKLNPLSRDAIQNSAHVLSERLNKADEAVQCLDELLLLYPDDQGARIGRAVLNARAGRDAAAIQDVNVIISTSPDSITTYQIACVFSRLSVRTKSHAETALRFLTAAFNSQPQIHTMAEHDADLDPIRNDVDFMDLMTACRRLSLPPATHVKAASSAIEITVLNKE